MTKKNTTTLLKINLLGPPSLTLSLPFVGCDLDFYICLKSTNAQAALRNGSSQSQGCLTVLQHSSHRQRAIGRQSWRC